MGPLNQDDRREGRKAMEKSLTAAARVRRRFRAGRPAKIKNVALTPLQAMHRLVTEADKARKLMGEEGLDPSDIQCALIYCTPESPGFENKGRTKWLPPPGETRDFFSSLDELASTHAVLFLGILWFQVDREAKPEDQKIVWVTQFLAGPKAEQWLLSAREGFTTGGNKVLDN